MHILKNNRLSLTEFESRELPTKAGGAAGMKKQPAVAVLEFVAFNRNVLEYNSC